MNSPRIHNGTYTIQNTETREHRTFRIRTQKPDAGFAPGKRIISLLTGPDNESSYTRFGFVDDNGIRVWQKKTGANGKPSAFDWYAIMVWEISIGDPKQRWSKYELLVEGRCVICNRKLTHPDSIKSGIGPECARRN